MIPFLPRHIATRGIYIYIVSLALVSVLYVRYAMPVWRMGLGLAFVTGFFLLTSRWSKVWTFRKRRQFESTLFFIAVVLRLIWVVGSYFYYIQVVGQPFEFLDMDSQAYHESGAWLASTPWSVTWDYYFRYGLEPISDAGYPIYLSLVYRLFGPVIIIPRIIKCFLSAWMCLLLYRLSARLMGEAQGRMAGIMCCLMPNLIIYCGYNLKETEMIFLEVAFLERLDYLLRKKNYLFLDIGLPIVLAGSLFLFRNVLGAIAVFTFATGVLISNAQSMKTGTKRAILIAFSVLFLTVIGGTTIKSEVEKYWEGRYENVETKRDIQTKAGNKWAQYATGTVMAPMIFVLPFSTMVDIEGQYVQLTKHGGNYIRNFMAFFVLIGLYELIRQKKYRPHLFLLIFFIGYLMVIAVSGFSNSERFLLPGLPGLIMMWSYGVSELNVKTYKYFPLWCVLVVVMELAWAFFKLGSRGLL